MTSRLLMAWLLGAAVVLSGCGGDGEDAELKRAEAKVTAEEKDLAEAQSAAADAAAEFCGASETYIVALDRYGDLLSSTAPTVGDVKDAGSDLSQPGEEATDAAEAAVQAQEEVKEAEKALKDARAALAELQASAGVPKEKSTDDSEPTEKLPPLPPAETVNRVKQAESELESAQEGINDRTPLVEASQQFNAAAVALEMAWLRLYADAGCLTDQKKQAQAAVGEYVATLQTALSEAGYYQGAVDGIYGPETVSAVEALQKAHGLPVTGTVDKATAAALEADLLAKGGAAAQDALASTAAVQQTLKLAGFWDGPVDGVWTPELTDALSSLQTELGVKPTGTVDAATIAAVEQALEEAQAPEPSPSESESESTEAPPPTESSS